MNCPNGHGKMPIKSIAKKVKFRGVDVTIQAEQHVCKVCGIEVGTLEQTAEMQRAISDAYRKGAELLTGREIRELRKQMNLTQAELADKINVGIASIKRWETGLIQTKSMDSALRRVFGSVKVEDMYSGNRDFSIPRIKLVLLEFEAQLGKQLIKEGDKMLFAAKYLWYADMLAYKELGCSMTGATYAALRLGPQLNNYRDLIEDIINADETAAEPLTREENKIISRISKKCPHKWDIYNAAHREGVWKKRAMGEIIPYSDAAELTEI